MDSLSLIQKIAVVAIPAIFAITLHEAAHGWMAGRLGDKTAQMLGRVTINPIRHIDPLGTIIVPLLMALFTPYMFGWAKPVPVNWRNFQKPRKDMGLVALAGPSANLLMALFWAMVARVGDLLYTQFELIALPLVLMGVAGVFVNALLLVLNMLPIPPLDGGRVVNALLPPRYSVVFSKLEPYGLFIVLALLFSGAFFYLLVPIVWLSSVILPASSNVLDGIQLLFTTQR
jgi:Zn-dependent protease